MVAAAKDGLAPPCSQPLTSADYSIPLSWRSKLNMPYRTHIKCAGFSRRTATIPKKLIHLRGGVSLALPCQGATYPLHCVVKRTGIRANTHNGLSHRPEREGLYA